MPKGYSSVIPREKILPLYKKLVRKYYKLYKVKNTTWSTDLEKIGKKLFPNFTGVYALNTIPKDLPNNSYFIFNTQPIERSGVHWLAAVKNKK